MGNLLVGGGGVETICEGRDERTDSLAVTSREEKKGGNSKVRDKNERKRGFQRRGKTVQGSRMGGSSKNTCTFSWEKRERRGKSSTSKIRREDDRISSRV